ncbi:TRAP transporter large permease subunit [Bradyrhizobium sp. 157]|uniref:TRAP transporter large permease n=1 Tax=Bradyrhizobium sp. 157 TaxID=2782631 RepID=UPI001FF71A8F|nr:TRAP transporter large permease subunit [Bradyrhizobium sp. 157]MCK1639236.1 TRAP transporter large permease subunit [Bradyrhizobium sp. 157]
MTAEALIGLIMLLVLLGAIFIGVPISFTLLFLAFAFGYVGMGATVFDLAYFQTIGLMKEELLAAVPLFIFMGFITEQAGLMERLFTAFRMLLAPVRGALFLVVILTSTVFAMATGIVGAAVTVLGIMASPIMTKAGYDAKLSAGTITAGGTLGILIPPSVMLIVMGPVLGVSVADLYAAAFGPGFLLAGMYIAYLMGRAFVNPKLGPPVPMDERIYSAWYIAREVIIGTLPLLGLITATLGSIIGGLATPTEAAGIGSVGALILSIAYRRFSLSGLQRALISTMATSSMVLLLAVTSNIFGAVFARLGSAHWITETMLGLQLPPSLMLIVVLLLIFLLGWPFEWPAIILVFLPIFYPIVKGMGIDLIWFAALVAVVLQTAFLSPPVAMSAYYLRQVVKGWSLATIYAGMFQFMILQVICVGLMIAFPGFATWFPHTLNEASRSQVIPEEYKKILEQQKRAPGLEDEDWLTPKKK